MSTVHSKTPRPFMKCNMRTLRCPVKRFDRVPSCSGSQAEVLQADDRVGPARVVVPGDLQALPRPLRHLGRQRRPGETQRGTTRYRTQTDLPPQVPSRWNVANPGWQSFAEKTHTFLCLVYTVHYPTPNYVMSYVYGRDWTRIFDGVPARLGKGQGAKEIGHNLARERPKFGHNLVRKRHKIGHSLEREWPSEAHFYAWTTKSRSQSSTRKKRGLGTILWAIDENIGTNLQAIISIFTSAVWKHKNSNYIM